MRSRLVILATTLAFAMSNASEGLAVALPAQSTTLLAAGTALLTPAAVRHKNRKLVRKRKNIQTQHKPPQTAQDKPPPTTPDTKPDTKPDKKPNKKSDKKPHKKPRHRPAISVVRGPAIICIDGQLVRQSCRCAGGIAATRIARAVLRCAAPTAAQKSNLKGKQTLASSATVSGQGTAGPAPIQAQAVRPQFVASEILVAVNIAASSAADAAIAQRYGLQRLEAWPINLIEQRIIRYKIPDRRPVATILSAMQGDPQIATSQPNYLYSRQAKAGDSKLATLQYALAKLNVPAAHGLSLGKGTRIAVIDSGIDKTHPDLAGTVADVFAAAGGLTTVPVDPHGTEVAGIVAARGALNGVAPSAGLLDVRVFDYDGDGETLATSVAILRGIDWASGKNATVVNISLSGPEDPMLERAISELSRNGTIIVAAAGNGGASAPAAYPAAYEDVIAVTATDSGDSLYAEANHGSYIDLAAPGVDVLSPSLGSAYSMISGTSFAAAHVSGVVALMLSRHPGMKPNEVRRALEAGASDLGKPGMDAEFGAGLVNALKALKQ